MFDDFDLFVQSDELAVIYYENPHDFDYDEDELDEVF